MAERYWSPVSELRCVLPSSIRTDSPAPPSEIATILTFTSFATWQPRARSGSSNVQLALSCVMK